MSNKVKKEASSMSFSLSKWFTRISEMKPSSLLITVIIISGAILLFSGIVYDITTPTSPAVYYNNKFYFLYPSLGEQFYFDTVISGILYAVGFVGLLSIYQSSRHAYNPRQAYMMMIIGASLLFVSYLFLETFIRVKISGF